MILVILDGQFLSKTKSPNTKRLFKNFLITSKRKPNLFETDRGNEVINNIFQIFLKNNNIKLFSRNTSLGAVFAERYNKTIIDLLKRPVFENGHGNWIDVLPRTTKQHINRVHTSITLTPIQASPKKNQENVYQTLLDKRKKTKPKFQKIDLVRTVEIIC